MHTESIEGFDAFRTVAKRLLSTHTAPDAVSLVDAQAGVETLPWADRPAPTEARDANDALRTEIRVPKAFVELAQRVACHRDSQRWALLYRLLYRLTHGEPALLGVLTDTDVARAGHMDHAVRRARHKMTAFVRFQKVKSVSGETDEYVAWYVPEHRVVELTAPFFVERFGSMRWAILTPDASVGWDRKQLHFGPGVGAREAHARLPGDALEDLWRSYYANIFNPARVKVAAMQREMPKRHWATLPEADLIAQLLADAPARVAAMIDVQQAAAARSALDFLPRSDRLSDSPSNPRSNPPSHRATRQRSLETLRESARDCRGCELYESATQTVFGEGPADAPLMLVGEQPGDTEDLAGRAFVGPAGQILRSALADAGVPIDRIYMTNTVKHFRHRLDGPRRLHATPKVGDVRACKPWLDEELSLVAPRVVVALGMTAGRALLGPLSRGEERGIWRPTAAGASRGALLTWHPSAVLREPDRAKEITQELCEHLRMAWVVASRVLRRQNGVVPATPFSRILSDGETFRGTTAEVAEVTE